MTTFGGIKREVMEHGRYRLLWSVGICVIVFCCVIIICALFDRQQKRVHYLSTKENAAEVGGQLAKAIQNEINTRLVTVQALVAFKNAQPSFSYGEFLKFADYVRNNDANILSLQFAPEGIVKYVTDPERNAAAIGHELLIDPHRSKAAFDAIDSGNFLIVGPVDLVQDGVGLIARKPIYDVSDQNKKQFWGFATIVIDFAAVTDLFPENNAQSLYRYALHDISKGAENRAIWGEVDILESEPYIAQIELAAGTWQLATVPLSGWPIAWPGATKFRLVSVALATILTLFTLLLLRQPAQLRQAVSAATSDLQTTEQRLREAHRVAKIGSLTLCPNAFIGLSAEASALLGVKDHVERFELEDFAKLVHPRDRDRVRIDLEEVIVCGREVESTFRLNRGDGSIAVIKLRAQRRHELYDDGQLLSGTLQDVTEETNNEERLRRAQKMEAIGKLTGGVAHDFNNLLAVIQGNSELLELTLDHDLDLLNEIQKAAHRGAALTQRLLAYARQQPLSSKQTDLAYLIRGMERLLSRTIGEHIDVMLDLPSDLWQVKVDPGQIEDAILNLALNARDSMARGGTLRIKCKNTYMNRNDAARIQDLSEGSYVLTSISDTGTGMDEHVKERAFEPFFTTKGVGQGSGLGLSMVCGLAQQSGGAILIESQIGVGTTIEIYLPRVVNAKNVEPILRTQVDSPFGDWETILVIEDNIVLLQVLKRMLKGLHYTVLEAQTVDAAQRLLDSRSDIVLVLTDVVLPGGLSGLDFVASLDKRNWRPEIIIMSGFPNAEGGTDHKALLHHSFLKKPFTRESLADIIHKRLKVHRTLKSNVAILPSRRA